jgi:thiol-disulfide isomerase/thioredoxin
VESKVLIKIHSRCEAINGSMDSFNFGKYIDETMKTKISIILMLVSIVITDASAQDAKKIFTIAYDKCKEIRSANYEMIYRRKVLTRNDTLLRNYHIDFEKLSDDTLYGIKFRLQQSQIYEGKNETYATWYTGDEEIALNPQDSTATVTSKALYSNDIKNFSHERIFYSPFVFPKKFFEGNILDDTSTSFEILGYEMMAGRQCVKVSKRNAGRKDDEFKIFNVVYVIWVDSALNIPLRFDFDLDAVMSVDTLHQYLSFEIKHYTLNTVYDSNYFSAQAIPQFYKLKDYVPYKQPELLAKGAMAPAWKLVSLDGKEYSIKDFTGRILLLDFFYKSCYPCMKALPLLQALHEKYKDKGLTVIGINPHDDVKENDMKNFLAKRGITYLTLYGAKETAKAYKVSGYPTIYITGKDGKIIGTQVGYSEEMEKELEKIVDAYLQ